MGRTAEEIITHLALSATSTRLAMEKSQSAKINGSYILDRYDENLEDWLRSCDISPIEFGQAFRKTRFKIMVREPSKHNKKWSLMHKEEGKGPYLGTRSKFRRKNITFLR
jgi:hypothetical protein